MRQPEHFFPSYTRLEHLADACVHIAGLVFSVAATVFLLVAALRTLPASAIAGLIVYCAGLIGMFGASAAYNLVSHGTLKEVLRRLDHSAIFVMIAGSYTPFAIVVGGNAGGFMLAAVWAIAVIGVSVKLRFPRRFDRLSILLYLAAGLARAAGNRASDGNAAKPGPVAFGHWRHRLHGGCTVPPHGVAALP